MDEREIKSGDLGYLMGQVKATLDANTKALERLEAGFSSSLKAHDTRINALEKSAVRTGLISGGLSSVIVILFAAALRKFLGW